MLIGLDFDNTLVIYDELFAKVAREKGVTSDEALKNKRSIRDYLRSVDKEELFTEIQGEVYGKRIIEARAANNMIDTLIELKKRGIRLTIVSHKTKTPYKGPKYNLHASAWGWIKENLKDQDGMQLIGEKDVYFEETKEKKISRIKECKCTHFIDDLPEILEMIDDKVVKILYSSDNKPEGNGIKVMSNWTQLKRILDDG